jgi:hypothetical protein
MKRSNRALALALLASGVVLAALLFGPAVLEGVIKPMAMGIWVLLRIFVLSVDQAKLWTFLTLFLFLFLFLFLAYRAARAMLDASPGPGAESAEPDKNATLGDIEYWKYMFAETPRDDREYGLAQRELAKLLLSAYASRERVVNDFALHNDFKSRKIPLPESVYSFVFDDGRIASRSRLRAWLRRVSGRDRVEYRRSIGQYLEFLNSYMEISDDE